MLLNASVGPRNIRLRLVKPLKRPSVTMSNEDTVSALLSLVMLRLVRVGQRAKVDNGCTRRSSQLALYVTQQRYILLQAQHGAHFVS